MKPAIIKDETKADLKIEGFLLPKPETSEKKKIEEENQQDLIQKNIKN